MAMTLLSSIFILVSLYLLCPQADDYFQIRRLYTILGSSIFYKVSEGCHVLYYQSVGGSVSSSVHC